MLNVIFCNIGLVLIGIFINKFIRKMRWEELKSILLRMLPATLFLVMTYAVFTPSTLFLQNISEFSIPYIGIVPVILWVAFLLCTVVLFVVLCVVSDKNAVYFNSFLFLIALGLYVQGNFLNPTFPSLDGAPIDWSVYYKRAVVSNLLWPVFLAAVFAAAVHWKSKSQKIMKWISYWCVSIQMVTLAVLLLTSEREADTYGISKEGEFSVGAKENIVVFIVDSLQTSVMKEYLASDNYPAGRMDDFTMFDNMVSGGAPTSIGLTVFVTGVEYDPLQSGKEFNEDLWEDVTLYDDLHENNYDVRFYTSISVPGISDKIIENCVPSDLHIGDYSGFTQQMYKLVNLYLMPQGLKQYFWLTTDDLTETILKDETHYSYGNVPFFTDMESAGALSTDYENAFRLYHIEGVHTPYATDENLQEAEEDSVTEQQVLRGVMKGIYQYIDYMKDAGIYDSSTIIIAGDHGRFEDGNPGATAAFLIKRPYEEAPLQTNSAPVHYRNVSSTLAAAFMEDYSAYGPSVYDITDESDVERLHTMDSPIRDKNTIDDSWDRADECRLIVPADAEEISGYQIWDPFTINTVDYKLGETIDYSSDNAFAEQINYRLYKENGAATASNELSVCLHIQDAGKDDLIFRYAYSKVYNGEQTMRIYANGNRVDTVVCKEENVNQNQEVTIPGGSIEDDTLLLRFVFPNAVTPNQLDRENGDTRVMSVSFTSMCIDKK